ncbi:hypothetical protein Esti_006732 [Eimeria stiedai]
MAAAATAPAAAQHSRVVASFEAAYTPDAVEAWSQHAAWCCYHASKAGAAAAAAEDEAAASTGGSLQDIFAVAMYEYNEASRTRTGGVSFYTVQQQQQQKGELAVQLALLHEAKSFGSLDLRWLCPPGGGGCCSGPPLSEQGSFESMLVVVGSDCALHAFRVSVHHEDEVSSSSSNSSSILRCSSIADVPLLRAPGKDQIGLGLDALLGNSHCIAATCSDGSAAVVSDLEFLSARWKAHEAEAWSLAISPSSNGNVVATGADDCKLRLWDMRANCGRPAVDKPITTSSSSGSSSSSDTNAHSSSSSRRGRARLHAENAKSHGMGVTALSFIPHAESLLLTGCYDGIVRCFDLRTLKIPLYELGASGGLWRLRWALGGAPQIGDPYSGGLGKEGPVLLAACCHGGCEVWGASAAEAATVSVCRLMGRAQEDISCGAPFGAEGGTCLEGLQQGLPAAWGAPLPSPRGAVPLLLLQMQQEGPPKEKGLSSTSGAASWT